MRINVHYTVYTAVYECVLGALRRIQTLACHIRGVCVWHHWTCLNDGGHWFRNADQEAQLASSLQGSEWTDMSKHHWLQLHLCLATSPIYTSRCNQALTCCHDDDWYLLFTCAAIHHFKWPKTLTAEADDRFVRTLLCLELPRAFSR